MRTPLVKISKAVLMTAAALLPTLGLPGALPQGATVTGGQGSISQSGSQMTINQTSQTFSVDWQSFSIAAGNSVRFVQPSATSSALNRVTGGDPSEIFGSLSSNGRVFLVNPAGITFAAGSSVNVGSLVASTLDLSPEKFHAGDFVFEGDSRSSITNLGTLQAATGGSVALIAAKIENQGQITAQRGSVAMGAGSRVRLSFGGLASLEVEAAAVDAAIEQGGGVRADGGSVLLTARAANRLASAVVNHTGVIEARSLSVDAKGSIVLDGGDGAVVAVGKTDASGSASVDGGSVAIRGGFTSLGGVIAADGAKGGSVVASGVSTLSLADTVSAKGLSSDGGTISYSSASRIIEIGGSNTDVSGARNGGSISVTSTNRLASSGVYLAKGLAGNGGKVDLTAADLRLLSVKIDASGGQNGGLVRLGGAFQGGKTPDTSAAYYDSFLGRWGSLAPIANAGQTFVNDATTIKVSGANGTGGTAVVWSDVQTTFLGGIDARGRISGGSAEISSAGTLRQASLVNVQLGNGKLLLDPKDITIGDAATVSNWSYAGIMGLFYVENRNLDHSALEAEDHFGSSVSLNAAGDRLAVGAWGDAGSGNVAINSGAVYLFGFTGTSFSGGSLLGTIGKGYTGGKNVDVSVLEAEDHFGSSVSLNAAGDRLAAGAWGDAGSGNVASGSGAVYLFGFTDTSFSGGSLLGTIGKGYTGGKNVDFSVLEAGDHFGTSVSLNSTGTRLAVGAEGDDGSGNVTSSSGAVYLLGFSDTSFSGGGLLGTIGKGYAGGKNVNVSVLETTDLFGGSVSLNAAGDRLAAGAYFDSGSGNVVSLSGAVYLFSFTDTSFSGGALMGRIGKGYTGGKNVDVSALQVQDYFGSGVSLNAAGDRLAVGAYWDGGSGNVAFASGAVYLFSFTDTSFSGGSLTGRIGKGYTGGKNVDVSVLEAWDSFGISVSLNAAGDRLAVGAYGDVGSGNVAINSGAVYLVGFSDTSFSSGSVWGAFGKGNFQIGKNVDVSALEPYDIFGGSVSLNAAGDRMAVGAPWDDNVWNSVSNQGAVYLFGFTDTSFSGGSLLGTIGKGYTGGNNVNVSALNGTMWFGWSVSLNAAGDRLAVGVPDDGGAGWLAWGSGAAYLFGFTDTSFSGGSLLGTIGKGYAGGKNIDVSALEAGDHFGTSVSLNSTGTRLAVGANDDAGSGNVASSSGAVYLFGFTDTSFSGGSLLGAIGKGYVGGKNVNISALEANDCFGSSVSLNAAGDRLAVGSYLDAGAGNMAAWSGAVYLFGFTDTSFSGGSLLGTIGKGYAGGKNVDVSALEAYDTFGVSVSLNSTGNRLAVGSYNDDGSGNVASASGAVYLFGFTDTSFSGGSLLGTIGKGYAGGKNVDVSALQANDYFGFSVSLNAAGDRLAVGARNDSGFGNVSSGSGAVYLFGFADTSFSGGSMLGTIGKGYAGGKNIDVSALEAGDNFGISVSLNASGNRLAVGAYSDDGSGSVASGSGAVYLFGFTGASFSGGSLLGTIGKGYAGGKNIDLSVLEAGDAFGRSVSLNAAGDRLAVGAIYDAGSGNLASGSGAAYLFGFTDTSFSGGSLLGTIGKGYAGGKNIDVSALESGDLFGISLSLNAAGDRLAVGASWDGGSGETASGSGAVHLFGFTDASFSGGVLFGTIGKGYAGGKNVAVSALEAYDLFGTSVSLNAAGDRLAVGAYSDDGSGNVASGSGAVRLFGFTDTSFSGGSLLGTIGKGYTGGKNVDVSVLEASDNFGISVSLNAAGDRLAVGAHYDGGSGNLASGSGAVRLFGFTDMSFLGGSLLGTIGKGYTGGKNVDVSALEAWDNFGISVSLNAAGDQLAVGAIYDGGSGNVASGSGAVYLFMAAPETGPYPALVASTFASRPEQSITVWAADLVAQLKAGTSVTLQASNDIRLSTVLNVVPTGSAGGNLTLQAGRSIYLDYAVTTGNGNLTLIGNDLLANGVIDLYRDTGTAVINTGTINTGTGSLTVDLRSGAGKTYSTAGAISLGSVTAGTLTVTSAAPSAAGSVQLSTSSIAGNLSIAANGAILASGAALAVGGTTTVTNKFSTNTASVTLSHSANAFAGSVAVSSGGNITLVNSGALTLGVTHADGALSVSTLTGNLTLNGALDSSKVAADAVILNAGSSASAGTAAGGDIILGTGSVSVLSGARATLYTGSLAGSTAMATSIGSGSGRFRYGSDESSSAYTAALGNGTYLIYREQPTLSLTVDSKSITYGQAVPTLTGTVTSGTLRNSDTAAYSVVGSTLSTAGYIKANSYTINATGLDVLGYSITTTAGTLTVAKKTLTLSGLTASNKTYDAGLTATLTGTATITSGAATAADGLYYGTDTVSLTGAAAGAFATKDADTGKTVTVSGLSLTGGDAANYQLDTLTLTADILKKTLTLSGLSASNKTYDAALGATLTGTAAITSGAATAADGLYYGTDTVSVTGTAAGAFATKDAGTGKTVTVSGLSLTGGDAANYQLGAVVLTADIGLRSVSVRAIDRSKVIGAADPALTYSVTSGSLAGADSFGGSLARTAGESVGDYSILVGTLSAGANYDLSFTSGVLSILPANAGGSLLDVSLITNPLWRIRLGDGLEEEVAKRSRIVWPGDTSRNPRFPAVKGADRGPEIVIEGQPISRVEPVAK
jgi:filamentous hemagglutinin family protein